MLSVRTKNTHTKIDQEWEARQQAIQQREKDFETEIQEWRNLDVSMEPLLQQRVERAKEQRRKRAEMEQARKEQGLTSDETRTLDNPEDQGVIQTAVQSDTQSHLSSDEAGLLDQLEAAGGHPNTLPKSSSGGGDGEPQMMVDETEPVRKRALTCFHEFVCLSIAFFPNASLYS